MNIQSVNNRILRFIAEHHVLSLATCSSEGPWCASCFYVYLPHRNVFIFTSNEDTRHAQEMLANPRVAGTIAL
ncbi:MAG: pyridoxamine 5'-phosphate oxidase family protein, partial [Bacteroidales bacterium]|nr:pyridoxamine 5'-phosphate oxidase family protein [Bacteroidales bacterium]